MRTKKNTHKKQKFTHKSSMQQTQKLAHKHLYHTPHWTQEEGEKKTKKRKGKVMQTLTLGGCT